MPPQISSNIHCLPITRVLDHDYKSSKISTRWQKCNIYSTQELIELRPKTSQAIHVYFQKVKKPPDGFCNHLFFASVIILIFDGLFLHRISRLSKVKKNCIRITTTEFSREKAEPVSIIMRECENAFVFKQFVLSLILRVNCSTITKRVIAPRNGYSTVKIVRNPRDHNKDRQSIF